jgi:L-fuconolactonase
MIELQGVPMPIDSHQHFWRISRGDCSWMSPDLKLLYRDSGPEDLQLLLSNHGIDRTILVQAAQTVAETEFTDPGAVEIIERMAGAPLIVGLRPKVQDIADDDWLVSPDLSPAFRTLIEQRLVFNALILPRHLSRLLVVADLYPDLSIVVDHGAKPFIREGVLDPWLADMVAVAARPNIVCKFSGLLTEAKADWTVSDLRPYVDHLLEVLGRSDSSGGVTGRSSILQAGTTGGERGP